MPPESGIFSIKAWWTKAPTQGTWSRSAVYEVVASNKVIASATVDPSQGGDAWFPIATVLLQRADTPLLRPRNGGAGALYADAILVESEARYNDGAAVREVTLSPFDAIVLRKK